MLKSIYRNSALIWYYKLDAEVDSPLSHRCTSHAKPKGTSELNGLRRSFIRGSLKSPGFFKAHGAETFLFPYTFHGGILNQTPRPQLKSDKIL
ncbi:hypothetical protein TWF217_004962 [Orbilia oligospora]|nr:hypothetical protein TWF217_004962 [Orbilia oligospora]